MTLIQPNDVGAAASTRDCLRSGTTLAANRHARLYRAGDPFVVYVCPRSERRRTIGAREEDGSGIHKPVLNGRLVAYDVSLCDRESRCSANIAVEQAVSGRLLRSIEEPSPDGPVEDLVVKANGAVAWTRSIGGEKTVVKSDADGRRIVLDTGAGVQFGSLALAGSTVYWTKDGRPVSATLK